MTIREVTRRIQWALWLSMVVGCVIPVRADEDQAAPPALTDVLKLERTTAIDRRDALAALRKTPLVLARWQSGFVSLNEEWLPFEAAAYTGRLADLHAEYLRLRSQTENSATGHWELSKWCRANGLAAEEAAHSLACIRLSPEADHRERLKRLGFEPVGGIWMSPEELRQWATEYQRTRDSLKAWGEKLTLVAEQLKMSGRRHRAALTTLDQMNSADAVPAIEWALCGKDETLALTAIGRLDRMDAYEATQALARQAVFNRWPLVRHSATEGLKTRRFEDFVPGLVSLLATDSTFRVEGTRDRPGSPFVFNFILFRETEDQFQMQVLEAFEPLHLRITVNARRGWRYYWLETRDRDLDRADFSRRVLEETYIQDKRVEAQNQRTSEVNGRVAAVLAAISGSSDRETPRDWWEWWNDYNQYETSKKPVRVERRRATDVTFSFHISSSCLAAGTIVWTRSGPRDVDQLQIGDLLLTQDVESGELGYAPVLLSTQRDPTSVFRLRWKGESLVATGGHRFWVPGEGWRRVNDLKPGSLLHTATGSIAVTSIEPMPDEAVYNVVISPTHNYFVGKQALLTHDVTLPRSTNRKVPGLVEP